MFNSKQHSFLSNFGLLTTCLVFTGSALFGQSNSEIDELLELSNARVIESAKSQHELFETPVGAFVIDEDMIQNAPANTIPELLRFAPGVHIQRSSNGIWGMGIRGMSSRFLGRTVFAVDEQGGFGDLLGGILGGEHVMLMADIASIEVVRGPGGGLWRSNASNGMVNVIPKTAFETAGTHLLSRIGSHEKWVEGRYGWSGSENSASRIYALLGDRKSNDNESLNDRWRNVKTGFRHDKLLKSDSLLSFTSEAYVSELGFHNSVRKLNSGLIEENNEDELQWGLSAQLKWTKNRHDKGGLVARSWINVMNLDSSYVGLERYLIGSEFRYVKNWNDRHQGTYIVGGKASHLYFNDSEVVEFDHDKMTWGSFNLSVSERWSLIPDQVNLEGSIFINHDTSLDKTLYQPDIRINYSPRKNTILWGSISKALKPIPIGFRYAQQFPYYSTKIQPVKIPTPDGNVIEIDSTTALAFVDQNTNEEELIAYEIGYKHEVNKLLSLGVSLFYNDYDQISYGYASGRPTPVLNVKNPYLTIPVKFSNIVEGYRYGMELNMEWIISSSITTNITYSVVEDSFDPFIKLEDPYLHELLNRAVDTMNNVPHHIGTICVKWSPSSRWRIDGTMRYSSSFLESIQHVPDESNKYLQADLRMSYRWNDACRISLVGRNLLKDQTWEGTLRDLIGSQGKIDREWYLECSLDF